MVRPRALLLAWRGIASAALLPEEGRSGVPQADRLHLAAPPAPRSGEGFYMPDLDGGTNTTKPALTDVCLACPVNRYQPARGATACILCPAGSSTQDEGNSECQPCPVGYYSPTSATACIAAPAGSYVNTSGSVSFAAW